ncbi:SDR family oxidoreductase [Mesorhizobium sp. M0854]
MAELQNSGNKAKSVVLDLTDGEAREDLVAMRDEIATLINNAGIFGVKPFVNVTADDFRKSYEVNVLSSAERIRRALPKMKSGGAIVNVASTAIFGSFNCSLRSVQGRRRGADEITRARVCRAWNPRQRRCTGTDRDSDAANLWNDDCSKLIRQLPLGRIGEPDVESAIGFRSSNKANYITGVVLIVDEGRTLNGFPLNRFPGR